ncbi:MAG: hypothetical protein LUC93_15150 [Planctomycetaceae bacterium]|nr:hypothetical protein [Planctomycetaceae bacterium]
MIRPRLFPAVVTACAFVFAIVSAQGVESPINPAEQPFIVVHAGSAEAALAVTETKPFQVLGLNSRDFAGAIPGAGAAVASLRSVLEAMTERQYTDPWGALIQRGTASSGRIGAFGFALPVAGASAEAVLADVGILLRGGLAEAMPYRGAGGRIAVYGDTDARDVFLGNRTRTPGAWRVSLAEFFQSRRDGVGVWVNPRPLLGALTLFSGFDARSFFTRYGMASPSAISIEVANNTGDLGLSLRLDNLLPGLAPLDDAPRVITIKGITPLLKVDLPAFERVWPLANVQADVLSLANINLLSLVPRAVNLTVWRDDAGELRWAAVLLMPDRDRAVAQMQRVLAWYEYLATVSPELFGYELTETARHEVVYRLRIADHACAMGVICLDVAVVEHAAVVLSGRSEDWPNPFDIATARTDTDNLLEWESTLDAQSKGDASAALAHYAQKNGLVRFDDTLFNQILPDADSGRAAAIGESLVITSRRGLLPLLIPGVVQELGSRFGLTEDLFTSR